MNIHYEYTLQHMNSIRPPYCSVGDTANVCHQKSKPYRVCAIIVCICIIWFVVYYGSLSYNIHGLRWTMADGVTQYKSERIGNGLYTLLDVEGSQHGTIANNGGTYDINIHNMGVRSCEFKNGSFFTL
jgi:hypothetical protein